eukprot:CCRYP_016994-RA/>CCRYP_016994-RA protein AED:0.39 eAED:0.19 QI:0/0/0/1/0.5/0.33/3/0/796
MESVFNTIAPDGSPLIVDNGVSCCISPHWDDFVEYHPSTVRIKDLSGLNSVAGQGMVQWLVRDINGHECKLLLPGYHVPQVSVQLLSPQSLFRAVGVTPSGAGLSPDKLWSRVKISSSRLPHAHAFGCPAYVLDPALQDGKKIPKWNNRACQGIIVGFSPNHSSMVPLVYNPHSHTSQYRVIFDVAFSTVPALNTPQEMDEQFIVFETSRESCVDPMMLMQGGPSWLMIGSPDELDSCRVQREARIRQSMPCFCLCPAQLSQRESPPGPIPARHLGHCASSRPFGHRLLLPYHNNLHPCPPFLHLLPHHPHLLPCCLLLHPGALSSITSVPPMISYQSTWRHGRMARLIVITLPPRVNGKPVLSHLSFPCPSMPWLLSPPGHNLPPVCLTLALDMAQSILLLRVRLDHLHQLSLQDNWSDVGVTISSGLSSEFASYFSPDLADDPTALTVEALHPCALKAKAAKSDADNPTWSQAMNSPDADKWFEAMEEELTTLERDLAAWDLVRCEPWIHVLPSTWAFWIKRFPNGLVKKFKARFCARGDCQKEGIDFWETWSPVVQWSTVRLMMTLAAKLDLCSAQADITAAFIHADLEPGEQMFVRQPAGFQRDARHCCCLADDLLFYSKSMDTIDSLISALHDEGIWIRKEGSAEGFLGVDVTRDTSSRRITLTQTGLRQRIVEALGLCSRSSRALSTPDESAPLPEDSEGDLASGAFTYAAVVGMLLYLSGHSRPDIAFAAPPMCPLYLRHTRKHELALIRIGRYLKGTMDKGLILSPSDEARIDCFPDADFAGLYGHED